MKTCNICKKDKSEDAFVDVFGWCRACYLGFRDYVDGTGIILNDEKENLR